MLLEVRACVKRFGGVTALAGTDLCVAAGEIHGLLGENGAGKSTLIKCLSGALAPDEGEILLDGVAAQIGSVRQAEALGFRFIHQELNLIPQFDVVENVFVGRPYPRRGPFIDRGAMADGVAEAAGAIAPDLPLDVPVGRLSTGQRQLATILRAFIATPRSGKAAPPRLVVMDEPTAALSEGEAKRLHQVVRALAARGIAVIFISHRLDEVLDLCDRYTVLRGGKTTGTGRIAEATRAMLIRLMSGRAAAGEPVPAAAASSSMVLSVRDLPFGPRGTRLDLAVREGEILGLYGLIGAGRSSLLKLLWGARRHAGGVIAIDGQKLAPGAIRARIRLGCAYLPEDRRAEGLIASRSIADNLALADWAAMRVWRGVPITSRARLRAHAERIRDRLGVRMASPSARPLTLSGGNQQKLLFGRWLGRPIRLLLLDEPTRGVDVGAKAEIHGLVRRLAASGAAVLMVTSDMDELLGLASRVEVFAAGERTASLAGAELTQARIVAAAFDHRAAADTAA